MLHSPWPASTIIIRANRNTGIEMRKKIARYRIRRLRRLFLPRTSREIAEIDLLARGLTCSRGRVYAMIEASSNFAGSRKAFDPSMN